MISRRIFRVTILAVLLALSGIVGLCARAHASGITASSIAIGSLDQNAGTAAISFNLTWQHSWRTSTGTQNWDAAWVFAKYRIGSGAWAHARLAQTGHTTPSTATLAVGLADPTAAYNNTSNPAVGAFIYRSSDGTGTFSPSGISLVWNYAADGVQVTDQIEVKVIAIEMVYVNEGSFFAGDNATSSAALKQGSSDNDPWRIGGEESLSVTNSSGNGSSSGTNAALYYYPGSGDSSGDSAGSAFTLPAAYPKGFGGFYVMKGEISQGQWVTFFNMLTDTQKSTRDITSSSNGGKNNDALSLRNNVSWTSGDATLPNQGGGATYDAVAMNYLSWADVAAYLDWAGLRPMSELEFEKAARGLSSVVSGEYAWGSTSITQATGISSAGLTAERGQSGSNCNYGNHASVQGPTRVGSFGAGATSRAEAGAGIYGNMDLSGNLWERPVSVGVSAGRSFEGKRHGDGALDSNGDANVTSWPGTSASGVCFRGGSWDTSSSYQTTSDRYYGATTDAARSSNRGGRGARSEPVESDPYWNNVVLLLRGDGTDGGTTFTDSSSSAKTVSVYADSKTSATQFKFGNAAMAFDGTGDYIDLADSEDWNFGTGDFTIEFWYRTATVSGSGEIIAQRTGTGFGPFVISRSTSTIAVLASSSGTAWLANPVVASATSSIAVNTWYHIALTRRSGIFFLYIDGQPVASNASYTSSSLVNSTSNLRIAGTTSNFTNGQIDELRITKGVDRYSSYFDFTTPTQAFSDSDSNWSAVKLLMHMDTHPLVDSSSSPLSGITTGGASAANQISSSFFKFGAGAANFAANNTNITLPDDGRFAVGSSDWTWEMWARAPDGQNFQRTGFLRTPFMGINSSGTTLTFTLSSNASAYTTLLARALPSTTDFYHYRVTRKGSRFSLHENGTLIAATTNSTANTGTLSSTMGGGAGNTNSTRGFIDEIRYTLGVARDAPANFPLQSKRFPAQ